MRFLAVLGLIAVPAIALAQTPTTTIHVTPPPFTVTPPAYDVKIPPLPALAVKTVAIDGNGHLIVTMSDNSTRDAGVLPNPSTQAIADLTARVAKLESGVVTTPPPTGGTTTPPPTGGTTTPPPAGVSVDAASKTVTLPAGFEPSDAMGSMQSGWTMIVQPGTYKKTFTNGGVVDNTTIKCAVTLKCVMDGQGGAGAGHRMIWGKACIHSYNASLTVDGFHFVNCGAPSGGNNYSNEAGIYLDLDDGKNHVLTVTHSGFDNNANGIFAAGGSGTVIVDQSVFGFSQPNGMNGAVNGSANGPAHDMYLAAETVEVKGSFFYGSAAHNVKTRATTTNIHDNPVMTMDGGRVADLSNGGKLIFNNNSVWFRDDTVFPKRTIGYATKAGVFGNSNLIGVGTENSNNGVPSGSITNSVFNISRTGTTIWVNGGSLDSSGNKVNFFGPGVLQMNGVVTGDLSAGSALPNAPAHPAAPPNPPSWYQP